MFFYDWQDVVAWVFIGLILLVLLLVGIANFFTNLFDGIHYKRLMRKKKSDPK